MRGSPLVALSTPVSIRGHRAPGPGPPGSPPLLPGSSIGGMVGRRQGKARLSAQLVEDEEYQLRHERVAGIDVAKAKADVCTRLPAVREGGRRVSRVEEVPATVPAVAA